MRHKSSGPFLIVLLVSCLLSGCQGAASREAKEHEKCLSEALGEYYKMMVGLQEARGSKKQEVILKHMKEVSIPALTTTIGQLEERHPKDAIVKEALDSITAHLKNTLESQELLLRGYEGNDVAAQERAVEVSAMSESLGQKAAAAYGKYCSEYRIEQFKPPQ